MKHVQTQKVFWKRRHLLNWVCKGELEEEIRSVWLGEGNPGGRSLWGKTLWSITVGELVPFAVATRVWARERRRGRNEMERSSRSRLWVRVSVANDGLLKPRKSSFGGISGAIVTRVRISPSKS